ncbi:MAG: DUF2269 family protein [Roseiflexaceae bacterium]|nr:DUF2269 family protein [Roseiflexaceae bacterium]
MHPPPDGANPLLYTVLVFLHMLLSMLAVGFNFTYVIWILRGTRDQAMLPFALKTVKFIDDYLANPFYLIAGLTGVLMILMGKQIGSFLWVAIAIYVVAMLVAYLIYTPLLGRQIRVLAAEGPDSAAYQQVAQRSSIVGAGMGAAVLVIVALKIFEPSFW